MSERPPRPDLIPTYRPTPSSNSSTSPLRRPFTHRQTRSSSKENDLVRAPRGIQTTALIGACWKAGATGARFLNLGKPIMKAIKTYSTRIDADLARIELDAAGVPAVVVGVGLA